MQKIIHTLKRVGFPEKQAIIYISLLELGEATSTAIARHSKLKRPTVYLALQEMLIFGFVSEIKKGKTRYYSASHPRKIKNFVQSRTEQMEEIYPDLVSTYHTSEKKPWIQVFEGMTGIKKIYQDIFRSLSRDEEMIGVTRIDAFEAGKEILDEYKRFLMRTKNPHLREFNLENEAGKAWEEETRKLRGKNHKIKFIPNHYDLGFADIFVYEEKIVLLSFEGDPTAVVIENKALSKSLKVMFEIAWQAHKE